MEKIYLFRLKKATMDEQTASKIIIRFAEKYVFGYDEDEDGYGLCSCGRGYNTNTCLYFQYQEDDYWCLRCRDENLDENDRHDICGECYDRTCVDTWCLKKEDPEEFFREQIKDKFKVFFEERWNEDDYTSKIKEDKEEESNYWVNFKDDFLHEVYRDELPVPYDETSAKFFRNEDAEADLWDDEEGHEESEAGLYEFVNDILGEFSLEDYRGEPIKDKFKAFFQKNWDEATFTKYKEELGEDEDGQGAAYFWDSFKERFLDGIEDAFAEEILEDIFIEDME